jgi:hypothetical protein
MKKSSLIRIRNKFTFSTLLLLILFAYNIAFSQWMQSGSVSGLGSWPSVFALDPNTIFVVGGATGPIIWRSTNGGVNFTQLQADGLPSSSSNRFLTCVFATDVNTIFVGDGSTQSNGLVKNAKVYRTTNGGTNWTTVLSSGTNVNGFINGIVFSRTNLNNGVVNCDPNSNAEKFKMWKTSDGGSNWTLFEPDAPNSAGAQNSVFYIDDYFYGFGLNTANARVAITTNGGANFSFYTISGGGGSNGFVSTVAFSTDKTNGLAGTSQTSTTIARTSNGGVNWFAQTIPCTITGNCNIKWVSGTSVVYLVISNSTESQCFKSINNGNNWIQYTFPSGSIYIMHTDLYYMQNLKDEGTEAYMFATNIAGSIYSLHESPMPVTLYSFKYSLKQRDVSLNWITSEEINNKGFEIYRKNYPNNNSWQLAGFVKGEGNKNTPTYYDFTDKNLPAGKYFYRLKQIDFNGNFEFFDLSGFIEIENPVKFNLAQNYPNPFNPSTKINFAIPQNGFVTLKVYDILGYEISTLISENKNAGYYEVEYKNDNLSTGTYFCKLSMNNSTAVKRMLYIK